MKPFSDMTKEELFEALPEILQEAAVENGFDFVLTANVDEYCDRMYDGSERQIVVNFDWTEIALPKDEYWKQEPKKQLTE